MMIRMSWVLGWAQFAFQSKTSRKRRVGRRNPQPLELLETRQLLSGSPTPVLIDDINHTVTGTGANPNNLTNINGTVYFAANDGTHGTELWKSDGTSSGTMLVDDINAGGNGSTPKYITNLNGTLYFQANDGTHGAELWQSDGTSAGTTLVDDIRSGSGGSSPTGMTVFNGMLYFRANDGANGNELWKSDGTSSGTVLVSNIHGGSIGSYPSSFFGVGSTLFFDANDGPNGNELWKTDGTSSGTAMVKNIRPGASYGQGYGSAPHYFTNLNGQLYFSANDGAHGYQLWKSDGTSTGTVAITSVSTSIYGGFAPSSILNLNGTLYFFASDDAHGTELWSSDGTSTGTAILADMVSGTGGSNPSSLTNVNGTLFFSATDGTHQNELWKSNGTSGGTVQIEDINLTSGSDPRYLTNVNGTLFFRANDGTNGAELWKSDGTSDGTSLVKSINPGSLSSYPKYLTNVNGTLFFQANDATNGTELWKSDGSSAGTALVDVIAVQTVASGARYFTNVNGAIFFSADDGTNGAELWKTNGTSAGTVMVADIRPDGASNPKYLTNVNGTLFFQANDGTHGYELWKSDGTSSGTVLVDDIYPGANSPNLKYLTNVNGTLFFRATDPSHGAELWKSNGTSSGTVLVDDINPTTNVTYGYPNSSSPSNFTNANGVLYFQANDGSTGTELWRSDGTSSGTFLVKDINPNSGNAAPTTLVNVSGTLYFVATESTHGTELWRSDGTSSGTVLVDDIVANAGSSFPAALTNVNGLLYFDDSGAGHGRELWTSDGTSNGTALVKDIYPGGTGSNPSGFTLANGSLFFVAKGGSDGYQLWQTDGTSSGTAVVRVVNPNPAYGASPYSLTNVNGTLYYVSNDGSNGYELWTSDGTSNGTVLAGDINPGSGSSSPRTLTSINNNLFFSADDGFHGSEPFDFNLDAFPPTAAVTTPAPTIKVTGGSGSTTTIEITYSDVGTGINAGTIDVSNISVDHGATVTNASANGNDVVYTITAPSSTWATSFQGTYTVTLTGTVQDNAGNAIATNSSFSTFLVDTVAPTASVSTAAPTINAAAGATNTTTITVTYADSGAGIDTSTFGLTNITVNNGATVTGFTPSGNAVQYSITAPAATWNASSQGTYTVSLTANVLDLAGNPVAANASFSTFTVDTVAPTLTSFTRSTPVGQNTTATSVTFLATFSEKVTGVDTNVGADFVLEGTGSSGGSIGTPTTSDGGTTWSIPVTGLSGSANGTVQVHQIHSTGIQDLAGNAFPATTFTSQSYILDHTAPTVVGIFRSAPASQFTNQTSVTFLVRFSEAVTGVDTNVVADFALAGTAIGGGTIGTPTTSNGGLSWLVPVTGLSSSANGTVQLNLTHNTGVADLAANALSTSTFSGASYTLDNTAPTLVTFTRSTPAGQFTNLSSVTFLTTFSEKVTGVDTNVGADFVLEGTASAAGSVGTPTTSDGGLTWSIPVTGLSGTANGTVQLHQLHSTGIQDLAGNAFPATTYTSQSYILDHAAPTVLGIFRSAPANQLTNGASVTFLLRYSEAVTGVDTNAGADFALTGSGGGTIGTPTTSNGGLSWLIPVTGLGSANGTVQLNLTHNTGVADLAGNALTTSTLSGASYTLDNTAPTLLTFTRSSPAGQYTTATSVTFLATFSEKVTGVDTNVGADFVLEGTGSSGGVIGTPTTSDGGTTWSIPVTGLSGTANGTVQLHQLHSTGIQDPAGNAFPATTYTSQSYILDHTAPTVLGIFRSAPANQITNGTSLTFLVRYSEAVTGVDTNVGADFALAGSGITGGTIGTPTTSNGGLSWLVPVTGLGSADGTVQLNLTHNTGVADLAGNGLTTSTFSGQPYTLDNTVPTLVTFTRSSPAGQNTNLSSVTFLTTFSEKVTGVDTNVGADFALEGTASSGGVVGTPTTSDGGLTWSIPVTGLSGTANGTVQLHQIHSTGIHDLAGNAFPATTYTSQSYILDHTAPTVVGIFRSTPAGQFTNQTSVTFLVKYSEAVTGVDTNVVADFALVGGAIGGGTIGTPTTSNGGLSWLIPVTGLSSSANGTVQLNLTHSTGVADLAGNALATSTFSGQGYTLDHTAPTGAWTQVTSPRTTAVASVTITFSEAMQTVALNNFTLNGTNISTLSGASIAQSGSSNSYVISGLSAFDSAAKTYTVAVVSGSSITDVAGNALSGTPSMSWVVSSTGPTLAPLAVSKASGSAAVLDDYWTLQSEEMRAPTAPLVDWS